MVKSCCFHKHMVNSQKNWSIEFVCYLIYIHVYTWVVFVNRMLQNKIMVLFLSRGCTIKQWVNVHLPLALRKLNFFLPGRYHFVSIFCQNSNSLWTDNIAFLHFNWYPTPVTLACNKMLNKVSLKINSNSTKSKT
jgi:hypothetical protein